MQGEQFDLIDSNPLYIPSADITTLEPEVREFEPRNALDGGADGLEFYRQITAAAPQYLTAQVWLLVEIGVGQGDSVKGMFASAGFSVIFTAKGPGGVVRVVGA